MKPNAQTELTKLQVIASLFADKYGDDLYFARQIKESIEATLPESDRGNFALFIRTAEKLAQSEAQPAELSTVQLVFAQEDQGFSLLSLREKLLHALKRTCRVERPLLILSGLKEAICPKGKRWTARRKKEYEEAVAFARAFCHSRSRPSAQLSLIIS